MEKTWAVDLLSLGANPSFTPSSVAFRGPGAEDIMSELALPTSDTQQAKQSFEFKGSMKSGSNFEMKYSQPG